jgi:Asp-tRNA(Asn)/Glu-tRNA(Gln) amidotransferase A subunit family amidase
LAQQSHDPEVWAAFEAALEVLQSLGLVLSEIDLPDSGKTVTAANTVIGFEAHLQFQGVLMANPTAPRSACNRLYSLTGHPALTLPMGLSHAGPPLAIQLASAHYAEALILQVGAAFEDTLGWYTDAQNCTVNPPCARAVPG